MTRQSAKHQPLHSRFGDAFVILSVTLLSLACGAWLITRFGLELSSAMLAALAIYCSLLLVHLLVRRSFADADEEDDLHDDAHWQSRAAEPFDMEPFEAALARHGAGAAPPTTAAPEPPLPRTRAGTWPEPLPMPADRASAAADPFRFRPSRSPYFEDDADPDPSSLGEPFGVDDTGEGPALPPEMNVEHIHDLIKKLADELNGTAARDDGATSTEAALAPANETEAMIARSVAALETTARTMRGAPADAPLRAASARAAGMASPAPAWWPTASATGTPPPLDPQLARIAEAIAAERIEVLLEPIRALAEGRASHYEVSMRLLTADGKTIEQTEFSRTAQGSGLMPRIDAARMLRAARVARRLGERGRQGSVLAAMAGESLTNDEFLDAAALQPGTDGRIGLVLSFTQSDVRTFTPVHAEALGSMAAGGFGFALEDVTDLDMDFGGLKAMGFEFVKLDAQVFLEGLRAPSGRVPASDICRYLSEFGLTLIVGRIEDEWLLARILGFGVLLGKGTLFGGSKLVKAEVVAEPGSVAA